MIGVVSRRNGRVATARAERAGAGPQRRERRAELVGERLRLRERAFVSRSAAGSSASVRCRFASWLANAWKTAF